MKLIIMTCNQFLLCYCLRWWVWYTSLSRCHWHWLHSASFWGKSLLITQPELITGSNATLMLNGLRAANWLKGRNTHRNAHSRAAVIHWSVLMGLQAAFFLRLSAVLKHTPESYSAPALFLNLFHPSLLLHLPPSILYAISPTSLPFFVSFTSPSLLSLLTAASSLYPPLHSPLSVRSFLSRPVCIYLCSILSSWTFSLPPHCLTTSFRQSLPPHSLCPPSGPSPFPSASFLSLPCCQVVTHQGRAANTHTHTRTLRHTQTLSRAKGMGDELNTLRRTRTHHALSAKWRAANSLLSHTGGAETSSETANTHTPTHTDTNSHMEYFLTLINGFCVNV